MRYTFRLFGIPLFWLDVEELVYDEPVVEPPSFEGGSAHNFERDYEPLSPTSHHEWEWEDRKKGFGFR